MIALTYGADADSVKNVLGADGCDPITGGRHQLESPRIVHDTSQHQVPSVVRPALRLLGVTDFLYLHHLPSDESAEQK